MDMNQYLAMFIDESNDHLQSLNEKMLELESSPDDLSIVQVIFRSAHTLKGMAATMGFEDLSSLTHQMENVLDLVRNDKLKMQDYIFDTLFQSLDALQAMVEDITGGGEGKADVSHIVASLQSIVKGDFVSGKAATISSVDTATASTSDEGAIQLDEFQYSVLEQSISEGHKVNYIDVAIREDCQLKAARAYLVFDLLERYGEVVKSNPSVQDIEQEKFDRSFSLFYITQKGASEIKGLIANLSEIDTVEVTDLDHGTLKQLCSGVRETAITSAPDSPKIEELKPVVVANDDAKHNRSGAHGGSTPSRTIRVDIDRLDVLMNLLSELLIDRSRLEQLAAEVKRSDLTETVEHMSRVGGDLQNIVLKLRMVPVDTVFNRFPRMVRDLAKSLDKKIDLIVEGAETELDRTVIDEIGDPLVHLLRNAVDHGVESTAKRIATGKPEIGTVHLRAFHSGNHVFIEIQDDGSGIDREKILAKGIKNGIVTESEGALMTNEQVYMLLFAAGFSTAEVISDISGRGVGLDVVRSKIESLNGIVSVESTLGKGTKFSVQLPLTLSIISAMLVKVGSEKYAIPLSSIVETGLIKQDKVKNVHGYTMISYRDSSIPLLSLAKLFDVPDYDESNEEETEIVVIRKGDRLAAITVEDFIGQSEIVIKNLGKYLPPIQGIAGATILGDGQVALIIDSNAFIK